LEGVTGDGYERGARRIKIGYMERFFKKWRGKRVFFPSKIYWRQTTAML
jgi:hypothetical protein